MRISEVVSRVGVQQSRDVGLERELTNLLHVTNQNYDTIMVEDIVAPCLRGAYFSCVLGHRSLALNIARTAIAPVVKVFKELGWGDGTLVIRDLGSCKLVGRIDAMRKIGNITEAVLVHIGRPGQAPALRAIVIASLTGWRVRLVCVSPYNGIITVTVFDCTSEQCKSIVQAAQEIAKKLHKSLVSREPPPPERGSWCARCQYREICHALQRIKEVAPHA